MFHTIRLGGFGERGAIRIQQPFIVMDEVFGALRSTSARDLDGRRPARATIPSMVERNLSREVRDGSTANFSFLVGHCYGSVRFIPTPLN